MSSIRFRGKDRARAVILLAGSIDDPGHFLTDPKGCLHGKTPQGLAPGRKSPCERCEKGRVRDKFGRESDCAVCAGRGWVWEDSGVPGVPVQTAETKAPSTKAPKRRTCMDCSGDGALPNGKRCRTCRGEGKIVVDGFVMADVDADELDPLERYELAVARRDKLGSYREYLLLEAELRARSPHLLGPFRRRYRQVPREVLERDDRYVARGLAFFVQWMPDPILVPRWVVDADERVQVAPRGRQVSGQQRLSRDRGWAERERAGESVSEIARSEGVDRETVRRGIKRVA